jgi:hypothetical protein
MLLTSQLRVEGTAEDSADLIIRIHQSLVIVDLFYDTQAKPALPTAPKVPNCVALAQLDLPDWPIER